MAKKKRKTHCKYQSKYYRKYGYSIKDAMAWTGWSMGSCWQAFQKPASRKAMLELIKLEESME